MLREKALKVLLIVLGILFTATVYPLTTILLQSSQASYGPMMLSLYVALGIFLLLAARNPSSNRSLISFTAWSSFAHAVVMTVQSTRDVSERSHLLGGSIGLLIIGALLIALSPRKEKVETVSTAAV